MPKAKKIREKKTEPKFRCQRNKNFLTYQCPTDCTENPIKSKEELLHFLHGKVDIDRFSIGCEINSNKGENEGAFHYHAYIEGKVDSYDCRFFDFKGVHPNWIKGSYARHVKYSQKFGDFITEGCEAKVDHFREALKLESSKDAINYLFEHEPKSMLLYGHNIRRNLERKLDSDKFAGKRYYGPYCFQPPKAWDSDIQTLVIVGDKGAGKTQWAKHYCDYQGGFLFCKGSLDALKHYNGQPWIIFDDIRVEDYPQMKCWSEVFDVCDGGGVKMRHKDAQIPPGVKKIWLCNQDRFPIPDIGGRVFENNRRACVVNTCGGYKFY